MDAITFWILVVCGVVALVTFVWVEVEGWKADHPKPVHYEFEPEHCDHEWQTWSEEVEAIVDYNSYGAAHPMETVTVYHHFCPKCGESYISEEY